MQSRAASEQAANLARLDELVGEDSFIAEEDEGAEESEGAEDGPAPVEDEEEE